METYAIACYNKDKDIRMKSSSGGIYSLIAEEVIKAKGVIFSACYTPNLEVEHCKITSIEELHRSRGSKYITSRLGNTFLEILKKLKNDQQVLFVGTPCQCSGLLSFLDKDYNNLLCVDLVCHGIPGRVAWRSYLKSMEQRGHKLIGVNMRDKSTGWSKANYSWLLQEECKTIIQKNSNVTFMKGFISDLYLRPSCYNCKFKGTTRNTDITLGDYWGVWNIQPEMDDDLGTSLVLIHTTKGKNILESISNKIVYKEAILEEAVKYNQSIIESVKYPKRRDLFFKHMNQGYDFITIVKKMTKVTFKTKMERKYIKMRTIICKYMGGG